jgi:hypothetical protein
MGFGGDGGPARQEEAELARLDLELLHSHGAQGLLSLKGIIFDVRDELGSGDAAKIFGALVGVRELHAFGGGLLTRLKAWDVVQQHDISRLVALGGLEVRSLDLSALDQVRSLSLSCHVVAMPAKDIWGSCRACQPIGQLSYDQLLTLERFEEHFRRRYKTVGLLAEADLRRLFGVDDKPTVEGGESANIHTLLEEGRLEELR